MSYSLGTRVDYATLIKVSAKERKGSDLLISSPLWRCANLAALFLLQVLHFFVPPVRPRRFGYFSRTHFPAMQNLVKSSSG
ncbi:MAG: hypothetical protein WD823_03910 [Sulfuricaulis sp.]|uniref:hypothetical protein n=1 Tax=Sulfuricaulis sp. TaxID=2003553 RepID=UPI0034A126C2